MARRSTNADYEEAAERLWQNYVVKKSKLSDISRANNNSELRSMLTKVIWRDNPSKKGRVNPLPETNPFWAFLEDVAHKATTRDGQPIIRFREPDFAVVTRYAKKTEAAENAETIKRIKENFYKQNNYYANKILQAQRKQSSQESKNIRRRLVKPTAGRSAAIPIKTKQKGYAAQLNTSNKQRAIEKTRLTKEMRLSAGGLTTQSRKTVSARQYSAHLKRSKPRITTNANETAKLLMKLDKLEHKSRKKPLTIYK